MTTRRTLLAAVAVAPALPALAQTTDPWDQARAIVRRIKAPTFPKRDFAITDYGARQGEVLNTEAFKKAIAACNAAGGGRVVVPAGSWLTGPIHLKSNVDLHIVQDATVRFSADPKDYLPLVFTRWEGIECMNYSPFIYAFEQENIAITGEGMIDGQCGKENWWPWKGNAYGGWVAGMPNQIPARAKLFKMAEDNVPVAQRVFGEGSWLRPMFIQPYRCRNVLIEGVSLRRSPMWQVHPVLCSNVTIRKMTITGDGPNTDGCDPESCTDLLIEDCIFDTGDDCIAINSGRNADGRRLAAPCQNIVIRNCRMADGHGAITVGSQISGGARNIFAENCVLDSPNLDVAVRIKNNALRGGLLENIYVRNLTIGQVARAVIGIEFNYEEGPNGPFIPRLHNLVVENVTCKNTLRALSVQSYEKGDIQGVTIRNCDFQGVKESARVEFVKDLKVSNVKVNGAPSTLV